MHSTQDYTEDQLHKLIYTSRQLNTQPLVHLFNCAIICSTMAQLSTVSTQMHECYDNVDILYCHNKAAKGVLFLPILNFTLLVGNATKHDSYFYSHRSTQLYNCKFNPSSCSGPFLGRWLAQGRPLHLQAGTQCYCNR